jgi:hypothetical protein
VTSDREGEGDAFLHAGEREMGSTLLHDAQQVLESSVTVAIVSLFSLGESGPSPKLVVLKPNRIIFKHIDANCTSFHLRVFLGLSNPQGQRQVSTISKPCDNFGERKAKLNQEMSRTT